VISLCSHVSIKTTTTTGCVILFYTLLHGSNGGRQFTGREMEIGHVTRPAPNSINSLSLTNQSVTARGVSSPQTLLDYREKCSSRDRGASGKKKGLGSTCEIKST